MTENGKSRWQDVRRLGMLLGIATGLTTLTGACVAGIIWMSNVQTKDEADIINAKHIEEHGSMLAEHEKFETKEHATEQMAQVVKAIDEVKDGQQETRHDIKQVHQWMWELVKHKRGR